jgi:hypothetical protein
MQKLPIGIQSFARLREDGYLYVDKTELIHQLMNLAPFVFLARPRRFGKSLLTTTLQEIYRGNRALFHGLWIEDKIDWQPRPVILINFNDLDYRSQPLDIGLANYMDELAALHGVILNTTHYKDKFRELIVELSTGQKVALLIDEYDKPITDLLENEQKVQEHVAVLKNLYSTLKSPIAEHLHFTLLTGVSKYGKVSISSDLNNLLDITLDRRFATLLGYTQEELEFYFSDYIDRLAGTYSMSRPDMLTQIAYWYNGYSWDGVHTVYVPFSTLVFLEEQTFANHWFATDISAFPTKLLRQSQMLTYALYDLLAESVVLNSIDLNTSDIVSILFQTGYLTVKQLRLSFSGETQYQLGFPNCVASRAFQQYLLADFLNLPVEHVADGILHDLHKALLSQNVEAFINILNSTFASIPHTLFLPQEAYYHSLVYLLLKLLGFTIRAEPLTSLGRTDAVLDLPEAVYIIEFKLQSSQENAQTALQQIRDKQYDAPYRSAGKPIILLGIAFDPVGRTISDWAVSGD